MNECYTHWLLLHEVEVKKRRKKGYENIKRIRCDGVQQKSDII